MVEKINLKQVEEENKKLRQETARFQKKEENISPPIPKLTSELMEIYMLGKKAGRIEGRKEFIVELRRVKEFAEKKEKQDGEM